MNAKAKAVKLLRELTWDIVPCGQVRDFMPSLGLTPASDDVNEMEHQESHVRLDRLLPIAEVIDDQCHGAAHVITAVMLRQDLECELDPEIEKHMLNQNESVLYSGTIAIISNLIDSGVLVLGKGSYV